MIHFSIVHKQIANQCEQGIPLKCQSSDRYMLSTVQSIKKPNPKNKNLGIANYCTVESAYF